MRIDDGTKETLRRLASYLAGHTVKDSEALAKRLTKVAKIGEVQRDDFTVADLNIIQAYINTQDFMAHVLREIAQQPQIPATAGADREAAKSEAQADRLREYQAAVQRLV